LKEPGQTGKTRVEAWIEKRAQRPVKDPRQTRIGKLATWMDRRQEKALDKEGIGSERLVGDGGSHYLYAPHGWEAVRAVEVQTNVGRSHNILYRKVRDPDPVAVAELHKRLGMEP
jgi:hypothetical protein